MSSSQSVAEFGPRTIAGSLQCTPSVLSTSASDFFGRHENHMRYVFPSLSTATSKQVPSFPPRTGLPPDFTQPALVSPRATASCASACSLTDPPISIRQTTQLTRPLAVINPPGNL